MGTSSQRPCPGGRAQGDQAEPAAFRSAGLGRMSWGSRDWNQQVLLEPEERMGAEGPQLGEGERSAPEGPTVLGEQDRRVMLGGSRFKWKGFCPWETLGRLGSWRCSLSAGKSWGLMEGPSSPRVWPDAGDSGTTPAAQALGAESSALGLGGAHSAPAGLGSRGQLCPLTLGSRSGWRPSCPPAPLTSAVSPPGLQSWRTPSEEKNVLWGGGMLGESCQQNSAAWAAENPVFVN